jgi:hypothetical protein
MRPLPSRSPGWPAIIETKIDPEAVSTYTLSGVSTPSVTVQPAVTRPDAAPGVVLAAGVSGAGVFSGAEPQADRMSTKAAHEVTRESRFTGKPPW